MEEKLEQIKKKLNTERANRIRGKIEGLDVPDDRKCELHTQAGINICLSLIELHLERIADALEKIAGVNGVIAIDPKGWEAK